MSRFRYIRPVAKGLVLGLLVAACGGGDAATTTTTEALATTSTTAATATTETPSTTAADTSALGEVVVELPTTIATPEQAAAATWLVWDEGTCSFVETDDHPDSYQATLRDDGEADYRFAWTPEDNVFDTLIVANESFRVAAEESDTEVTEFDNQYPSTEEPLIVADQVVQYDPDVVVSMNVLADLNPAIMGKYKDACIPAIAHSVPADGVPFFGGGEWFAVGRASAEYLVPVASDRGWTPEDTSVVLCSDSAFVQDETSPYASLIGFREVINESFAVGDENIYEIQCPSDIVTDQANTLDWLTAHPDVEHMIMFGINDLRALGMVNALKDAGRDANGIVGGIGLSQESIGPLCAGDNTFLTSVDFVPQLWGQYGIALAQDVAEGNPIPAEVYPQATVVDRDTIDQAKC